MVNVNDRVKINTKHSIFEGKTGTVTSVFTDEETCAVQLDASNSVSGFFVSELEPAPALDKYVIRNQGEDHTTLSLEMTPEEAAFLSRVIEGLNAGADDYAPTLEMRKENSEREN